MIKTFGKEVLALQAVEGYFENGRFHASGKLAPVRGRRRAIVTILDEPAREQTSPGSAHAEAWHEFLQEINKIKDEPLPEFERVKFRESDI